MWHTLEGVAARRRIGAAMRFSGRIGGIDEAGAQPDWRIGAVEFMMRRRIDHDLHARAATAIRRVRASALALLAKRAVPPLSLQMARAMRASSK